VLILVVGSLLQVCTTFDSSQVDPANCFVGVSQSGPPAPHVVASCVGVVAGPPSLRHRTSLSILTLRESLDRIVSSLSVLCFCESLGRSSLLVGTVLSKSTRLDLELSPIHPVKLSRVRGVVVVVSFSSFVTPLHFSTLLFSSS